ncbi:hypothetical protein [Kribbella jiaozuonensis]|uniref:hypothetical protein n=1 Tax=Kribbella jiaozuonensis TaxID=2575441 RepID=UPI0014851789|nr:hypothetical protein [Kribbella jiaozuonensis]
MASTAAATAATTGETIAVTGVRTGETAARIAATDGVDPILDPSYRVTRRPPSAKPDRQAKTGRPDAEGGQV